MANGNGAGVKQLLTNITELLHKVINMNVNLISSFKTGIIDLLSHQKIIVEKIKRIESFETTINKISDEQQHFREMGIQITNDIKTLQAAIERSTEKGASDILCNVSDKIEDLKTEVLRGIDALQERQHEHLMELLNKQMDLSSQQGTVQTKDAGETRRERIRQRFLLWTAVLIALASGIFGLIQLVLKQIARGG